MSVISLDPDTKLDGVPKRKIFLDSRLARPAERVKEATAIRNQLCLLCNDVDAGIRSRVENTGEKIKYLGVLQQASSRYWTIVGSTIAIIVGINIVGGGWKLWKWLKQRTKKDPWPVQVNEPGGVESFKRRLHAREWKPSNLMISDD